MSENDSAFQDPIDPDPSNSGVASTPQVGDEQLLELQLLDEAVARFESMVQELRAYARGMLRSSDPAFTLEATDLVNMAYLKLADRQIPEMEDCKSVFGLYVVAMRDQLRDYLRRKSRTKRGGESQRRGPNFLEDLSSAGVDPATFVDLLDELDQMGDHRKVQAVVGRIFFSLTNKELAVQLDVSEKTVEADVREAREWLKRRLDEA